MTKLVNNDKIKELVSKIDEYKIGSKNLEFEDYIFEDTTNNNGFMVFLNKKYNQKSEKEICNKLENYIYTERYYYCEKLSKKTKQSIIFILFNPSKACPDYRDDTINNCYELVKDKYNKMEVLNVFSSRNPQVNKDYLLNHFDNSRNIQFIEEFLKKRQGYDVVLGWGYGKEKDYNNVLQKIRQIIKKYKLKEYSIGINIESKELLDYLTKKQQHPGNQSWSSYGGFKIAAILKEIKEDL